MPIPTSLLEPPHPSAATAGANASVRRAAGPVLLATLGGTESDGAARLAWELAGRTCGDVQVLTALEPAAPVDVRFTVMPPPAGELLAAQRDAQLAAVRDQLGRMAHDGCDWPVAAVDGPADEAIARVAMEEDARVIVLGRGRHGVVGRLAGGETVLRLLRRTEVPVYAAAPDVAGLARRVVVALDFSPYSVHAARVALDLVAPDASVTLAHVWPGVPAVAPALTGWEHAYERALPELFERVRGEIGAAEGLQVETVTLSGRSPGRAVVGFALAAGADLVVSATHGHGFLARLVLGSVATELLRGAPCSFLCVPGSAAAHAAARETAAARLLRETVPSTEWASALDRLSERRAGHPCALASGDARESASGEGASGEVGPLPLAGIGYAPDARTLVLTFGATPAATPQLTHVVRGVTAVDTHVEPDGTVRVLEVAGADGSALLRFL